MRESTSSYYSATDRQTDRLKRKGKEAKKGYVTKTNSCAPFNVTGKHIFPCILVTDEQ